MVGLEYDGFLAALLYLAAFSARGDSKATLARRVGEVLVAMRQCAAATPKHQTEDPELTALLQPATIALLDDHSAHLRAIFRAAVAMADGGLLDLAAGGGGGGGRQQQQKQRGQAEEEEEEEEELRFAGFVELCRSLRLFPERLTASDCAAGIATAAATAATTGGGGAGTSDSLRLCSWPQKKRRQLTILLAETALALSCSLVPFASRSLGSLPHCHGRVQSWPPPGKRHCSVAPNSKNSRSASRASSRCSADCRRSSDRRWRKPVGPQGCSVCSRSWASRGTLWSGSTAAHSPLMQLLLLVAAVAAAVAAAAVRTPRWMRRSYSGGLGR